MITTAPLPTLKNLTTWHQAADPAAPWRRSGQSAMVTPRSSWSLAWLAALRGKSPVVALPAWFCNGSLAPLRAMGARLTFVPVDGDGVPDWDSVKQADLVVAVHGFGRAAPLDGARAACVRTGALLVEDAAHALAPASGLGQHGDYVLFSPHKVLPLPDGAVLLSNGPPLPASPHLAQSLAWPWLRRRLLQRFLPDVLRRFLPQGGQTDFLADPPTEDAGSPFSASGLSLKLMAGVDLAAEAARRRANAAALRQAIGGLDGWKPMFAEDGPAPYRFVLRCKDAETAAARYAALRRAKLPVESWPDLPPEVEGGHAVNLRRTVILLPVHGSLPKGYQRLYAQALKS